MSGRYIPSSNDFRVDYSNMQPTRYTNLSDIYHNVNGIIEGQQQNKQRQNLIDMAQRRQMVNQQVSPFLKNNDLSGAANAAFDQGDVEAGQGFQNQQAEQQANQRKLSTENLELFHKVTGYVAPAFYELSQNPNPQARMRGVKSIVDTYAPHVDKIIPDWSKSVMDKVGNGDPVQLEIGASNGLRVHDQITQHLDQIKQQQEQSNWQNTFDANQQNQDLNRSVTMRGQDMRSQPTAPQQSNGRPLPANVIEKFTKAQATHENAKQFENTFKDEYAGQPLMGGLSNTWGNIAGDDTGQSSWWKNYQENKNQQRNALFGGALTPTEQQEYDKQDITPGMNPGEVRKRLARQRELAERGYSRLTQNYGKGGYDTSGFQEPINAFRQGLQQQQQQQSPADIRKNGYVPFRGSR